MASAQASEWKEIKQSDGQTLYFNKMVSIPILTHRLVSLFSKNQQLSKLRRSCSKSRSSGPKIMPQTLTPITSPLSTVIKEARAKTKKCSSFSMRGT